MTEACVRGLADLWMLSDGSLSPPLFLVFSPMPRSQLRKANAFIAACTPTGDQFVPLGSKCCVLAAAREFQISTITVALAASFYQRVVRQPATPRSRLEAFLASVAGTSGFVCRNPGHRTRPLVFQAPALDTGDDPWALVMYATCLHLAVKLVHRPHNTPARYGGYSLNAMVTFLCGMRLHEDDIASTEAWLLRSLRYTLLPRPRTSLPVSPGSTGGTSDTSEVSQSDVSLSDVSLLCMEELEDL